MLSQRLSEEDISYFSPSNYLGLACTEAADWTGKEEWQPTPEAELGAPLTFHQKADFAAEVAVVAHQNYIEEELRGSHGLVGKPVAPINFKHNAVRQQFATLKGQVAEKTELVEQHGPYVATVDPWGRSGARYLSYAGLARFANDAKRPSFTPLADMIKAPQPQESVERVVLGKRASTFSLLVGATVELFSGETLEWAKSKMPKFRTVRSVGAVALSR